MSGFLSRLHGMMVLQDLTFPVVRLPVTTFMILDWVLRKKRFTVTFRTMNEIRSFLIRNETQDFLTQIERLKRDVRRESESNFDEVLTSMLSGAENEAMQTKYVMACLTAIKGTIHKPTSTTALTQLLRDSKLFGNRTSFSSTLRKVLYSRIFFQKIQMKLLTIWLW